MDIHQSLEAFLATVDFGSFSQAGRRLGLPPSIITHRVNRLEERLNTQFFHRSTRRLSLTETGKGFLTRARMVAAEIDQLIAYPEEHEAAIEDHLRIKVPTSLTTPSLCSAINQFQQDFPGVRMELDIIDHPLDPLVERYDFALNILPRAFEGCVDIPLGHVDRVLSASPAYLAERGMPAHPRDLLDHDCLSFLPSQHLWQLRGPDGPIELKLTPKLAANNQGVLITSAIEGGGLFLAAKHLVRDHLSAGTLIEVLCNFPADRLAVRGSVPERRYNDPAVRQLVGRIETVFRINGL